VVQAASGEREGIINAGRGRLITPKSLANTRRICYTRPVAKRPDFSKRVLIREDLAQLQRRLSQMSVIAVQDFYRTAYLTCRLDEGHFPSARSIQELVQAWKQMRRWG
jgi:hypothetical protein